MRKAAKIDRTQTEIVKGLRAAGATVRSTAAIGQGFPDIAVGHQGRNFLFEIKDGAKTASHRKLTPDEQAFHAGWRGQVSIIHTLEEAFLTLGIKTR